MAKLGPTPSQTVGPYYSMRLGGDGQNVLAGRDTPGERIRIEGTVLDGDGNHIEDALLEVWQANAGGRYHHPEDAREEIALDEGFTGFGRAGTDFVTGEYWFETVKPGPVPDPEGELQAPHINVIVQARGMLDPSYTRIYFEDETDANRSDLVLATVPPDRRQTLIARCIDRDGFPKVYRFDIRFQGDDETVFFDF
jgi:protocatechuate 3,4-dioxygenase alpha subunit